MTVTGMNEIMISTSNSTKKSGMGLGLSIVHRILDAYDSWMDVESEASKGTTFTLQFKQIGSTG